MNEAIGALVSLFFSKDNLHNFILTAILGLLLYIIIKIHAAKLFTQHNTLWKKHEDDSNPELIKMKKDIVDDDKRLLRDVKSTMDLFSLNLESFKKDILHEYAQLKTQIGFIIKSSDENSQEIEELREKLEKLEDKIHKIEVKLGNISSGF